MAEEELIETVREHRELFDTTDPNYMKVKLKQVIWLEIAKELNFKDGEEAKNMWLKLRGSYRDARRRQLKYLKSGAAPEHIKPWRFQMQMSFLEPFMSTGPREGNIVDNSDDDSHLLFEPPITESFENDGVEYTCEKKRCSQLCPDGNIPRVDEERNNVELLYVTDNVDYNTGSSRRTKSSLPPTIISTQLMHKRKKNNDLCGILKRSVEQREERSRERAEDRRKSLEQNRILDDPLYNFFISMYQLTKNMPSSYQHRVRAQVFQAVSKAEEAIMNINSDRSPSIPSSSPHESASGSIPSPFPPSHASSVSTSDTNLSFRPQERIA